MKRSRAGNATVFLAVGIGIIVVAAVLFYMYQRHLRKQREEQQAVVLLPIAHHGHRVRTASHVRPPEVAAPSLEPTFTITGPVGNRKIIQKVLPSYPLWAEEQGVSADVRLAFRVDDTGSVAPNVWVTRMGQPDLDAAAVQALKQWKFAPLDHPVPMAPEPNVVKDVERGDPAIIDFSFKLIKPPVRI